MTPRQPLAAYQACLVALVGSMLLSHCRHASDNGAVKDDSVGGDAGQPAPVAFDVNDLSIMFAHKDTQIYPNIALDAPSLNALGIRDLWPNATAFQPLVAFAGGKDFAGDTAFLADLVAPTNAQPQGQFALGDATAPLFSPVHRKIGVAVRNGVEQDDVDAQVKSLGSFNDQTKWRVIALRIDPCAQADGATCNVELRLIVQPFGGPPGARPRLLDRSAHLLFHLGKLDVAHARFDASLPRAGLAKTFADLIGDLQHIKALSAASGGVTDGQPLGTHPGLAAELNAGGGLTNGPVALAVIKLINDYTAGGLSAATSMQLITDVAPWVFFQGAVVGGVWHPIGITGNNQQFSIRFAPQGTGFVPAPLSRPTTSDLFAIGRNNAGLTPQNAFIAYQIDNPGKYGSVDGPPKVSVVNTDCISCHSTSSRLSSDTNAGSAANVPTNRQAMYVPADGITGYPAPRIVTQFIWSFRDFGAFGALTSPGVMGRVINEAAEAARFLDDDVMPVMFGTTLAKKGLACRDSANSDHATLHAKLWDCMVVQPGEFDQCKSVICNASDPGAPAGSPP